MATVRHAVDIAAPVETVYEFGLNPTNWVRANPALVRIDNIEETDKGVRATATYDAIVTSVPVTFQLTILEPYAATTMEFDGAGMSGEVRYSFTETESGTTLAQTVVFEFGDSLLGRAIEQVVRQSTARQFVTALENTKNLIEAETTGA